MEKKNTLINIESIPRITNFGRVHTANVKKYVIGPCRQGCGLRFTVCTRAQEARALKRAGSSDLAVMQGSGYYQRDKTRCQTLYWTFREIMQRMLAIIPWHSFAASNSEGTNYFFSRSFSVLFNFSSANKYLY